MATQDPASGLIQADTDLPERVPEHVPDHTPLYELETTDKRTIQHYANEHPPASPPSQKRWTRWPILLIGALLIAIISGLIGGFIGKALESNNTLASASSTPTASGSAGASQPTSSPTPSGIALAEAQDTPERLGCPETSGRTVNSTIANVRYKFYCNVNWVGSDLLAIAANNISECIESCSSYNDYNPDTQDNGICVGATWVPAWSVNLTEAWLKVQKASSCFLKWKIEGRPAAADGFDAVGICLDGNCPT